MADEVVTEAEVLPGTDTIYLDGFLGATVTAGQSVRVDSSQEIQLADADASITTAQAKGIAMNGGVSGQPCRIAIGGHIDPGFTVAVDGIYIVSATAGGITSVADLASGMFLHILGIGITTSSLLLINKFSGVAKP